MRLDQLSCAVSALTTRSKIPAHAPARRAHDRGATSQVRIRPTKRRRRFRRARRETPDRRCAWLRRAARPGLPANRCGSTSTLLPQGCSVKHADAQCAWCACRRREPRPIEYRRIGRRAASCRLSLCARRSAMARLQQILARSASRVSSRAPDTGMRKARERGRFTRRQVEQVAGEITRMLGRRPVAQSRRMRGRNIRGGRFDRRHIEQITRDAAHGIRRRTAAQTRDEPTKRSKSPARVALFTSARSRAFSTQGCASRTKYGASSRPTARADSSCPSAPSHARRNRPRPPLCGAKRLAGAHAAQVIGNTRNCVPTVSAVDDAHTSA